MVFCKLSPLQLKLYTAFLNSKPVQALLASTAADDETDTAVKGNKKKRRSSKPAAAAACDAADKENIAPGAVADVVQQSAPQQKCEALAPLVAITALKKLCCHPDLIFEMLNKHKQDEKQRQQQQQLMELMAAQRRVSERAAAAGVNYASLHGGSDDDDDDAEKKPKG